MLNPMTAIESLARVSTGLNVLEQRVQGLIQGTIQRSPEIFQDLGDFDNVALLSEGFARASTDFAALAGPKHADLAGKLASDAATTGRMSAVLDATAQTGAGFSVPSTQTVFQSHLAEATEVLKDIAAARRNLIG